MILSSVPVPHKTLRECGTRIGINFLFLFLVYIFFSVLAVEGRAATIAAQSCSQAHVQAAVTSASRGDTVTVPAGSCTWTSGLTITKAITLQGGVGGTTKISSGFTARSVNSITDTGNYLIYFRSSNPSSDENERIRITGFTFDQNYRSSGIMIYNLSTTPIRKVIIDNNIFDDCWDGGKSTWTSIYALITYGTVYGVAHSNTFNGFLKMANYGMEAQSWNKFYMNHGSADLFYFEDNVINSSGQTSHTDESWFLAVSTNGGTGGVYRYNTFLTSRGFSYNGVTFNVHGNRAAGPEYAGMGGEMYGNYIADTTATSNTYIKFQLHALRAGKNLVFYNYIRGNGHAGTLFTEYDGADTVSPTNYSCGSSTLYPTSSTGIKSCAPDGQPQHVYRTYTWNNRYGLADGGSGTHISGNAQGGAAPIKTPRENIDFFQYNPSCTSTSCSSGVGCGNSTPSGTCAAGVGYWKTAQSCSEVPAGSIGANPATPLSGTLYRCSSTNTWTPYYTPYTYPHPLRTGGGDDDGTINAPKGFRLVN